MIIQPLVEGHGEQEAVPLLLRRIAHEAHLFDVKINEPIRRKYSELTNEDSLKKSVRLAMRFRPDAVLIIFDTDVFNFCPKTDAASFLKWARVETFGTPCELVMAHQEYEAWLLAALNSLRGKFGIENTATYAGDPEAPRGPKGKLESFMNPPTYIETFHQTKMTAAMDMGLAYTNSRSFRHLVSAFGRLVSHPALFSAWPPTPIS